MGNAGSDGHFDHAVKLSIEGLKSLFLLNGGAATALIALTDKAPGARDYSVPTVLFGVASFLTVLTFVVGYFSQLSYANHSFSAENGQHEAAMQAFNRHDLWQTVGICVVSLSLLTSGTAMAFAFERATTVKSPRQLQTCATANPATEPTGQRKPLSTLPTAAAHRGKTGPAT